MWDQVDVSEMPVLFITQTAENASFQTKLPTKWTLRTELYLYGANNGERDESAMTTLNPIIDAIEAALAPKGGVEEQTLGGLVHRCRIDGAVQIVEGVFDQKTVVVIPVVIFVS